MIRESATGARPGPRRSEPESPVTDTPTSAEDIVQELLPRYGPYNRDNTVRAGYLIDELVRYLNYATQHAAGLPWPVAAADLVGVLTAATGKLPQALEQTGRRLDTFAPWPEFVDRRGDFHRQPERAHAEAVARAELARAELAQAAAIAGELSARLATVQNLLSPLGLNAAVDDEDDE
jgi:hypothetical protein